MIPANLAPWALIAVIPVALVVIIVMVILLRRSSQSSQFADAQEEDGEQAEAPVEEDVPAGLSISSAFRRARKLLRRASDGEPYEIPFIILAGAEGSRPADLLGSASIDMPFGDPTEAETSLAMGRGFWFFDRGVVLDIAGEHVLKANGKASDERGWQEIVRRLERFRPKRPVDGMVVTFSAAELLDAAGSELRRADVAARTARIYRKVVDLQSRLGFRIPIYVLVTGCESLTGFHALCRSVRPSSREEMLGWSSPYSVDTSYRAAWVDEAMKTLTSRLDDLQMEIFADGTAGGGADDLFRLPRAFRNLGPSIRVALDQLFKSSAYHGSLMLRGIYFCGRENGNMLGGEQTAFVKQLFEQKIFQEHGVAAPTTRTRMARDRSVRIAQVATACVALFCGGGLAWASYQLNKENRILEPILQATTSYLVEKHERVSDEKLKLWAMSLLDNMSAIDFGSYGSVFVPSSWFDPRGRRVEKAMATAFSKVILESLRLELGERVQLLRDHAHDRFVNLAVAQGTSPLSIDAVPEYVQLRRYVGDMTTLEAKAQQLNRLCSSRGGTLDDLSDVISYLWGERLSSQYKARNEMYDRALLDASCMRFEPKMYAPDAQAAASELSHDAFNRLFEESPFQARVAKLSASLQPGGWPSGTNGAAAFAGLSTQMQELDRDLADPQIEWAFHEDLSLGPNFQRLLAEMARSEFFGPELVGRIRAEGGQWLGHYQRSLATMDSPMTGPILTIADGRARRQLSPGTMLLKTALESFLGQGFVNQQRFDRQIQTHLLAGQRMGWDPALLEQATAVYQAYERFQSKTLSVFPPEMRGSIDQVARDNAGRQMVTLIAEGQTFDVVPPSVSATLEDDVRAGLARFQSEVGPVSESLDALTKVKAMDGRRDLAAAMSSEAYRLLTDVDRLLHDDEPYRPRHRGFDWWDGNGSPSPAAWDMRDGADVPVYLETTRNRVTILARNYAAPLINWFVKAGMTDRGDSRGLVTAWQGIIDDLRDYDAKKPGSSLAALEDYVTVSMAKVTPANCNAASLPNGYRPNRRYFSVRLQELSRQLGERCQQISVRDAGARYAELARYFNARLAGRYPFADAPPARGEREADPEAVKGFYDLFDQSQAVIRAVPTAAISDPAFAPARAFVAEMAAVRPLFAPYLDSQKPNAAPALDVEASFRVLRDHEIDGDQIIGWTVTVGDQSVSNRDNKKKLHWVPGRPVRIALRWASDSPRIPVLSQTERGASLQDRTLTYEYTNQWSLLTALEQHTATSEPAFKDAEPVTLAFRVQTQPVGSTKPLDDSARVFMRLSLLAPDSAKPLELPKFPSVAPPMGAQVAEGEP